jgi:hypothetical protein
MEAIQIIRTVTGTGEGNGPMINIHDGFLNTTAWVGFFPNADRVALDYHPYVCFSTQLPVNLENIDTFETLPCTTWGAQINDSMVGFGMTTAGEFSNALTDCGLWINGVNEGSRYEGTYDTGTVTYNPVGDCGPWDDFSDYSQSTKNALMKFTLSSMDALQVSPYIVLSTTLTVCYPSRIGFIGLGRSETRLLLVKWRLHFGRISSGLQTGGFLRTLRRLSELANPAHHGSRHCCLGRQEVRALDRFQHRSLPSTRGLHLRSAGVGSSPCFLHTRRLALFLRFRDPRSRRL